VSLRGNSFAKQVLREASLSLALRAVQLSATIAAFRMDANDTHAA
jgi:hypothetical protein